MNLVHERLTTKTALNISGILIGCLTDVEQRSPTGYAPDALFKRILIRMFDGQAAAWVTHDTENDDQIVGFLVCDLFLDAMGTRIAFLTVGWIAPGYKGAPFDSGTETIERWADEQGCKEIRSATKRGVAAYARWIEKRGYEQAETIFVKRLHK